MERKHIGLTTIRTDDHVWANRFQTAVVRGNDELILWGLGPDLQIGDVVALYMTDNEYIAPQDRESISRLYSVAAIIPGKKYRNHVFLHKCVEITPLDYPTLINDPIGLKPNEFYNAGHIKIPWTRKRSTEFWSLVLKKQPDLEHVIRSRLLESVSEYDIAISYPGESWTEAMRIKRWCESEELSVFCVTSTGELTYDEETPLQELLKVVFASAKVKVFLIPGPSQYSKWIRFEWEAGINSETGSILLLELDNSEKRQFSQSRTPKNIIATVRYQPPHEKEILEKIKSMLKQN